MLIGIKKLNREIMRIARQLNKLFNKLHREITRIARQLNKLFNKLHREITRIARQLDKFILIIVFKLFNLNKRFFRVIGPDLVELSDIEFLSKTISFFSAAGFEKKDQFKKILISLEDGLVTRFEIFFEYFYQFQKYVLPHNKFSNPGNHVLLLGTNRLFSYNDWLNHLKKAEVELYPRHIGNFSIHTKYAEDKIYIKCKDEYKVSIILSIYNGMEFFENCMEILINQSIFDECELIIIDANSSDNISNAIKKYINRFKNIKYIFVPFKIKIYEAWNMAILESKGQYLTTANVDDIRSIESIEIQKKFLDDNPSASVTYQDFYYTLQPNLDFNIIKKIGIKSSLPDIVDENIIDFNSPHNAPMWRKKLHDEIGLFDSGFESAGDWEFWMRVIIAGKIIKKNNEMHVGYYHNPKGISTNPNGKGISEGIAVRRRHFPAIVKRFYL